MKRIVLSILAVAAAGGLASAQSVSLDASQSVTTEVAVVNEFEITSAAGTVDLVLNGATVPTELTYTTNDGFTYAITASASAWASTQLTTVFPVLTANGGTLIDSGNALTSASLATGITNVDGATLNVALEASSSDFLLAGDYDTTVTYTFE